MPIRSKRDGQAGRVGQDGRVSEEQTGIIHDVVQFPGNSNPPIPQISKSLVPIFAIPFTPPFDVIAELCDRRDRYTAIDRENPITIYNYPTAIKISINSLRRRVESYSLGKGVTLTCCAFNGINALTADPAISDLCRYRKQLDLLISSNSPTHETDFEEATSWFDHFETPMPEGDGRFTLYVNPNLRKAISGLAEDLGCKSQYGLFLLAGMMTLVTQPYILDNHRQTMRASIDRFFRRIAFRGKMARAVLEFIDPNLVAEREIEIEEEDYRP